MRVLLEILTDSHGRGAVSTWRFEVAPPDGAASGLPWQIARVEKLTLVNGLYRLSLDAASEYDVRNLVLQEPDLTLTIPSGHAFVARTEDGPTAVVVLGRGKVEFSPRPAAERGQVHTFSGSDVLTTDFNTLFVRLNPGAFDARIAPDTFVPRAVSASDFRKATQLFETLLPLSFQIDLGDLSTDRWSLAPGPSDAVVEIGTHKYGTLTYAKAAGEPEDISFFDRRHKKNIAMYANA